MTRPALDQDMLNIWGGGQLIAFSGLDGATDFDRGLVLRTVAERAALEVVLPAGATIQFSDSTPATCRVAGDFFELQTDNGRVRGAMLDAHHLLIEGPCEVSGDKRIGAVQRAGRTLIAPAGGLDPAKVDADLDATIEQRRRWLESLAVPADLPEPSRRTLVKCLSVMKTQVNTPQGVIRRRWTTPDRWPHQGMWLWDSAFHAIGWRHVDLALAREMIEAVFDGQRDDGMIPIRTDPAGPTSAIMTQPPVLTLAVMEIDEREPDDAWLAKVYPHLSAYVRWDLANRDSDGAGLAEWYIEHSPTCRSGESGMDNSSRFDCAAALDAADFNAFLACECELLARIAERIGRADDARRWAETHRRLCERINERLWNEEAGLYVDCRADTGEQSDVLAGSGFMPLICGAPSPQQAKRLVEHLRNPETFGTAFPVPTIAASQPQYYDKDMWRGPTWVNFNWLIARGLERYGYRDEAANLRAKTRRQIERWYHAGGSIYEFFDDRGEVAPPALPRKGRNAPQVSPLHQVIMDYGWTATLYVDMVLPLPHGRGSFSPPCFRSP